MGMKAKSAIFLLMLCAVLLSSCGYHYKCGVTFGSSSCSSSGSGIGTSGGGTGANAVFIFNILSTGSINGISLTSGTSATLQNLPSFTAPTVPTGDVSAEVVIAQKKFLYAAFPASQLLFAWSIDATSGNLTGVSGSPFAIPSLGNVVFNDTGTNMSAIAVDPSGSFLYIAAASNGSIDAYQINSDGTLTQVPGAPFNTVGTIQPWNLYFDGLGKYLYVTSGFGIGQTVAAYTIQSSGALSVVPGSPFPFNIWQLTGDPSGKYMIGTSASSSINGMVDDPNLYVFGITQSGANAGALTQVPGSPFPTQAVPFNLAFQPVASNGSFVYTFSGTSSVEGYQLDLNSGTLTPMSGSPFIHLGTGMWGQFDQSGTSLFIYHASLGVLNVAPNTGDLSESVAILPLDSSTMYYTVSDAP
jgi:6-phosphogluconolactonase (cycloisomerase 2 family)